MRDFYHGYGSLEKMLPISLTLISAFFLFPLILIKWKFHGKSCKQTPSLPPGPTPWPIVGNLPELWRNKPAFRWIHGLMESLNTEIACIRLGGVHVIPVTSPELAREFLKKHDIVFASRPLSMSTKYASRGFKSTALVPWGDQWKKMRKLVVSQIINSTTTRWLLNKRTEEADNLVRFIYNQCKNADDHSINGSVVDVRLAARHYCGNVIRKMIFNRRYFGKGKKDGGPGVEEVEHIESLFTILVHLNAFAVSDYLPCLTPLDLDGHEKIVSEAMKIVTSYEDPIVDERIRRWRDGEKTDAEDLLDAFILAKDSNGKATLSVEEIKAQITELMLAAVDNPSNCIEWTLAEMLNQPEILQKAVEEIDRVVGRERWVEESDIPQLNYVKACAREGFRLHPIAPFNVPHVSMQDATVAGHFIPKGSHVILSRYGLGRNPRVWKEPLRFKPDRHLKKEEDGFSMADDQMVELVEHELRFISFSTGRRGCLGIALGSAMTVMPLARLLQGFFWSLPPNQEEIDLSESTNDLYMAKPLRAHANPRLAASLYPAE
ncbi:tryptophan N-monooxygenase CYP79A68-like [Juglans microcarpa x Juglans regia]|uniref:tryptophan N-monooxygenase CYP79A68-like n=1 Tax=Juglans microcarpa x Juglans regia TaxID=2249226 RepID=UPI001B7ECB2E|nr:tryptophan N-monooxygenase CYP79A68-like [Juglans microcarpa x Juglans regia]